MPVEQCAVVPSTLRATLQQSCYSPKPALPSTGASAYAAARVCLTQSDLFHNVFADLSDQPHIGTILLVYLGSLARLSIPMQDDVCRMVVRDLVRHDRLQTLRKLLETSLLIESKVLACYLLSLSGGDRAIQQMALDMLATLKDDNVRAVVRRQIVWFSLMSRLLTTYYAFADHRRSTVGTG